MNRRLLDDAADWIFPARCGLCGAFGNSLCDRCRTGMREVGEALDWLAPDLAPARAVYAYAGPAGDAVRKLKFSRITPLAEAMAERMREEFQCFECAFDAVVPVPIHWIRRAERGFNQAELLVSRIPLPLIRGTLRRVRHTRQQAKLTPEERRTNLVGAFRSNAVAGKRVLLVDDVVTTGVTARECARALSAAGAAGVGLLVFAAAHPQDGA